jgi:phosphatidylinositol alpha-1,6-mannosyltransferase
MKVLFVTRKWPPAVGGMETYARELVAELAGRVDLEVMALPGRADGSVPSALDVAGFLARAAGHIATSGRRYDVVHLGDLVLLPLAPLARRTSRVVATVHGLDLLYADRTGAKPAVYRRWLDIGRRFGGTHRLVANSENTAALARARDFPAVDAVPLGVRLPPEMPETLAPQPYVLFVGRIVRRKGLAWFAREVLPTLGGMSLKVVGAPLDAAETAAAAACPGVEMLGRVDTATLVRLRREATAVVMPNRTTEDGTDVEGFGLAALEPPADGVPVVAAGIEGITDAVADGRTGWLLPEGDVAAWRDRLVGIAGWSLQERRRFALDARQCLETRFGWDRTAEGTIESYRRALG